MNVGNFRLRKCGVVGLVSLMMVGGFSIASDEAAYVAEAAPMSGGDTPMCNGREATIIGTSQNDVLFGTANPDGDVIWADAGNDVIKNLDGGDWVCAGPGNDFVTAGAAFVSGGDGNDRIFLRGGVTALGGPGNDRFMPILGDLFIYGGVGRDTIDMRRIATFPNTEGAFVGLHRGFGEWNAGGALWVRGTVAEMYSVENVIGTEHRDIIYGNHRDNVLRGLGGGDEIYGMAGTDVLHGGEGDDRLDGGEGTDTLHGGPGTGDIGRNGGSDDSGLNLWFTRSDWCVSN